LLIDDVGVKEMVVQNEALKGIVVGMIVALLRNHISCDLIELL
jgi:hypothetical protein